MRELHGNRVPSLGAFFLPRGFTSMQVGSFISVPDNRTDRRDKPHHKRHETVRDSGRLFTRIGDYTVTSDSCVN